MAIGSGQNCLALLAMVARSSVFATIAAILVATATLAQSADNLVEEGARQYKTGNYGEASQTLMTALALSPQNAEAHYYLANCFMYLKRNQDAVNEYQEALRYGGNTPTAIYAQEALAKMSAINGAGTNNKHPGPDAVTHSLTEIGRQEALMDGNMRNRSAAEVADINQVGLEHAQQVQIRGAQRVNDMQNSYYTDKRGNTYAKYTPDEINGAANRYQNRADQLRAQTAEAARNAQNGYEQHSQMAHQSAANLADQLKQAPLSSDGFKLLPDGTNLYVRHYGSK
jgi:tetratricopeptide (TPR) repeat protein